MYSYIQIYSHIQMQAGVLQSVLLRVINVANWTQLWKTPPTISCRLLTVNKLTKSTQIKTARNTL